jgi:hypothetical protein
MSTLISLVSGYLVVVAIVGPLFIIGCVVQSLFNSPRILKPEPPYTGPVYYFDSTRGERTREFLFAGVALALGIIAILMGCFN